MIWGPRQGVFNVAFRIQEISMSPDFIFQYNIQLEMEERNSLQIVLEIINISMYPVIILCRFD